ncbi:hypothetical protein HN51_030339 [Arachis hypogaea]
MKASKPNVNVTRGSKAKTQGKKAGYKKDDCAVSGGNGPEVRKKGDGGSRAVGPDSVEPSPADNNGPNEAKDGGSNGGEEENAIDNIPAVANSTEANPDQNGSNPGSEAVGDKEQKASKPGSEAVGDKEQNASKPGSEANEGSVEGSMQIPNPTSHDTQTENPTSRATTNVSSQPKAQQPFRRPKQTIRRPQVQGSLDADMTAATTSPAASEIIQFV